jgi:hypothetical protein
MASVRRQLEQLLGHALKTQNLQLLLRKLKVVDAGPPMAAAELKESLKKAKVGADLDASLGLRAVALRVVALACVCNRSAMASLTTLLIVQHATACMSMGLVAEHPCMCAS